MADDTRRMWTVPTDPDTGEVDMHLFGETMSEVMALIRRAGGASRQRAVRRQTDIPGVHVTVGVEIMWTLHAPLPKKPREAPPAPPVVEEPEPEPEAPAEEEEEALGAEGFPIDEDELLQEQEAALAASNGGSQG